MATESPAQKRGAFGDFLSDLRDGRTRGDVARAAGQSVDWYRKIETGSRTRALFSWEYTALARGLTTEARPVTAREVHQQAMKAGY